MTAELLTVMPLQYFPGYLVLAPVQFPLLQAPSGMLIGVSSKGSSRGQVPVVGGSAVVSLALLPSISMSPTAHTVCTSTVALPVKNAA